MFYNFFSLSAANMYKQARDTVNALAAFQSISHLTDHSKRLNEAELEEACQKTHIGPIGKILQSFLNSPEISEKKFQTLSDKLCCEVKKGEMLRSNVANFLIIHDFTTFDEYSIAGGSMMEIVTCRHESNPEKLLVAKYAHYNLKEMTTIESSLMGVISRPCKQSTGMDNTAEVLQILQDLGLEECNLTKEIANLTDFYELFKGHPLILIPTPYPELSQCDENKALEDKVLVMDFIPGDKLSKYFDRSTNTKHRHLIAKTLMTFLFSSLQRNFWYTDFNAGCAKIELTEDDKDIKKIGILDFGACMKLQPEQSQALINFCLNSQNIETFKEFLTSFNYAHMDNPEYINDLHTILKLYLEPLRHNKPQHFGEMPVMHEAYRAQMGALQSKTLEGPEYMLLFVKWFSSIAQIMYRLYLEEVPVNFYEIITSCRAPLKRASSSEGLTASSIEEPTESLQQPLPLNAPNNPHEE